MEKEKKSNNIKEEQKDNAMSNTEHQSNNDNEYSKNISEKRTAEFDNKEEQESQEKTSQPEENIDYNLAQFNFQQWQQPYQDYQNFLNQNQQKQEGYKYFLREFIGNRNIEEMKEKLADPKVQEKAMEMFMDYRNGKINDPILLQTISNLVNNPQLRQEFQKQSEQRKKEIETIKTCTKVGTVVFALGSAIAGCVLLGPWGLLLGIAGVLVGAAVGAVVGMAVNGIRRLCDKIKNAFQSLGNKVSNFFDKTIQNITDRVFGKNTNTLENAMAKMAQRAQTRDQMRYNNQKFGKTTNKIKINKDKIKAKNELEKNEKPNEKPIENKKEQVTEKIKQQSKIKDTKPSQDKNGNNKGYNNIKDQSAKNVDVNKMHKKPDINKLKEKQKDNAQNEKPNSKVEKKGIKEKPKGVELEQKNANKNKAETKSSQNKNTKKAENISLQTKKPAKSAQQQKTTFKLDMNQDNKATGLNAKGGQTQGAVVGQ